MRACVCLYVSPLFNRPLEKTVDEMKCVHHIFNKVQQAQTYHLYLYRYKKKPNPRLLLVLFIAAIHCICLRFFSLMLSASQYFGSFTISIQSLTWTRTQSFIAILGFLSVRLQNVISFNYNLLRTIWFFALVKQFYFIQWDNFHSSTSVAHCVQKYQWISIFHHATVALNNLVTKIVEYICVGVNDSMCHP